MTKKITAHASETKTIADYLDANRDQVANPIKALATTLGVTLKTNPGDFFADVAALARAAADHATHATAEHGAAALDVPGHSDALTLALARATAEAGRSRSAIHDAFGAAVAQRVFGKGATPRKPAALVTFLARAVTQLRDPAAKWDLVTDVVAVDVNKMAAVLSAVGATVEAHKSRHDAHKGGAVADKTARDRAADQLHDARNGVRKIAEGVFTLAGDHDGAAHVAIHRHAAPTLPVGGGGAPVAPVAPDAPRPG